MKRNCNKHTCVAFFESLQQVVTVAKRVAHTKEFNKQIFTKNMKYQKNIVVNTLKPGCLPNFQELEGDFSLFHKYIPYFNIKIPD